jgi:GTP-binding protein
MTSGTGLMYHVFDHFGPVVERNLAERSAGVMISNARGEVLAYALFNLQERGKLFVAPGEMVYEGQIVGETAREGDMVVNPLKGKKLTNIRTQSKDENVLLTPPVRMSLEQAMEYIGDDELVEVTPKSIRLRKRFLREGERKRAERVG